MSSKKGLNEPNDELARARAELQASGADWALLSTLENVTYVSHWEVPIDFGPAPAMRYGPPLALIGVRQQASSLLVSDNHVGSAMAEHVLDELVTHEFFPADRPLNARDNFVESVCGALRQAGLANGKVKLAIEEKTLPAILLRMLQSDFPNVELVEAGAALDSARRIKTA